MSQSATYWIFVAGNFAALCVEGVFLAVALIIAGWLGKRGCPNWLITVELIAVALLGVPVMIGVHAHFDKMSCRHSVDYAKCIEANQEAELPEWEPPEE
jgi:hypothetical protein